MRILHYFLGFPPYRTGGLTKYAYDLMQCQANDGNDIIALWPGEIKKIGGEPLIKQRKSNKGIKNYEIINPLPVSLDEGISDLEAYTKSCDKEVYIRFLREVHPDVIHIHTLMGLHKEFISSTNELGIKTVFTTHDYFGICPKVTLYRCGNVCENNHSCKDCVQCNHTALSLKKIQVMQSSLYRLLKNMPIVKQLRKRHRGNFFAKEEFLDMLDVDTNMCSKKYMILRKHYVDMLEAIELIHFNSHVAESVYKKYIKPKNSVVMTITHQGIVDNRKKNEWKATGKLRILYLSPAKPFKGYNVLKQALDEIWNCGNHNIELRLFDMVQNPSPYMVIEKEGYTYGELVDIFAETDILVAPSVWYETFGFTVLEAISNGVPVIVSEHVGAKEVIGDGGIVIDAGSVDKLKQVIVGMTEYELISLRKKVQAVKLKSWREFLEENYQLYI